MKCPICHAEFTDPGRSKGGKKSKRTLTPEQARKMVEAREKKRKTKENATPKNPKPARRKVGMKR